MQVRAHRIHLHTVEPELIGFTDFPRTNDGRVYHLGIRKGEIANRIVSH